jgi:protein-S-isoprenylcysteine O-methyltransferase Ste14
VLFQQRKPLADRRRAAAGSALFFVVAPGTVAGLVPWAITGWPAPDATGPGVVRVAAGALLVVVGLAGLVPAFARFVTEGLGTPAPLAPTEHLVVGGAYRHVRNPMYVAVLACVLGQALLFASWALLAYALVVWAAMAAFVRWYEEPVLAARYGASYDEYRARVPAWLPRVTWRARRPRRWRRRGTTRRRS